MADCGTLQSMPQLSDQALNAFGLISVLEIVDPQPFAMAFEPLHQRAAGNLARLVEQRRSRHWPRAASLARVGHISRTPECGTRRSSVLRSLFGRCYRQR
jgi:hypothetical protein